VKQDLHLFYADPGLAGSERNLQWLAAWAPIEREPTAFRVCHHCGERYEHVSLLEASGTRLHLYSRSSALYETDHVDAHLLGLADAIVLVVDARDFRIEAAVDRWRRLEALAQTVGRNPATLSVVGQLNRIASEPGCVWENGVQRDVRYVQVDEARARVLPPHAHWVEASTLDGQGVLETLRVAARCARRVV